MTNLETIAANRIIINPEKIPYLNMSISPCRSGSTALGLLFANSGYKFYYQPIKSILRNHRNDIISKWIIDYSESIITSKETIGTKGVETIFNPMNIVKEIYPHDKLKIIILVRNPFQTFLSWIRLFPDSDIKSFINSYNMIGSIQEALLDCDIESQHFVYDLLYDNNTNQIINTLFNNLGMTFEESSINWQEKDTGFGNRNVIIPKVPGNSDRFNSAHQDLMSSDNFILKPKNERECSRTERDMIESEGPYDIYINILKLSKIDLNII